MPFTTTDWKLLTFPEPRKLNQSIAQLHHAAQFVALIGNSLLPKADDDSQANLGWHFEKEALTGQEVEVNQKFRGALSYPTFELQLIDPNDFVITRLKVDGQTKASLLNWLKKETSKVGLTAEDLQPITHFSIPEHPTDNNAAFKLIALDFHEELAKYRHNAQIILETFAQKFEHATPVRVWPHHFDSGTYIPLSFEAPGKEDKSIGLGFAIPAGAITELYFYVYFWSKTGNEDLSDLPELHGNGFWVTEGWKGAALKASDVLKAKTPNDQYKMVHDFFVSAINSQMELIGANNFQLS